MPDTKFLEDLLPSQENLDSIRASLISYRDKIKESVPEFSLGKDVIFILSIFHIVINCNLFLQRLYVECLLMKRESYSTPYAINLVYVDRNMGNSLLKKNFPS